MGIASDAHALLLHKAISIFHTLCAALLRAFYSLLCQIEPNWTAATTLTGPYPFVDCTARCELGSAALDKLMIAGRLTACYCEKQLRRIACVVCAPASAAAAAASAPETTANQLAELVVEALSMAQTASEIDKIITSAASCSPLDNGCGPDRPSSSFS
jgi:hypothetical protein